jgi:hypothetical protein
MKRSWCVIVFLFLFIVALPGREMIGDIFQAAVWTG